MAADITNSHATLSSTSYDVQHADVSTVDTDTISQLADTAESDHNNNNDLSSEEVTIAKLHEAIQGNGDECIIKVTEFLLSNNDFDVNAVMPTNGYTALHLAAQLEDEFNAEEVTLHLLNHGADPFIKDTSLRTAADYAFSRGYVHLAEYLMFGETTVDEAIAEARRMREDHFSTSLLQATKNGMIDDMRTCLRRGANANALNEHGVGALHFAVARCPADIMLTVVQMLVVGGTDVNLPDQEGDTALNLLIKCGSYGPDGAMVTLAKYLLDMKAKSDLTDLDGKDAVMLATERQYDDVVALFPKSKDVQQSPVLHVLKTNENTQNESPYAASSESAVTTETTAETTERAAAKDERTAKESTLHLLYEALRNGSLSTVMQHLPNNKDNINKPGEDGNAPIHLIILRDSDDSRKLIFENLLECGTDINLQRQTDGKTALHLAVERNSKISVQMLLDAEADINMTSQGETPHAIAIRLKNTEVAQLITIYLMKSNKKKANSKTCLVM